jgi:quercetin dioxygenase-like cupin family protein
MSQTRTHERNGEAATVRTGRPLDGDGEPVAGPVLNLDPEGRAAALFRRSSAPLVSDPAGRSWATLLERGERPELLQWLAPDAARPPAHVHPTAETFTAVEGELTVVVEGEPTRLASGETATVEPGREHTFRNDTDGVVAFRAEVPSMLMVEGLYTAWGATHERGGDGEYGGPGALRALLVGADMHDETTMTAAPVGLQRALWATVGRVARLLGRDGVEKRYLEGSFWRRHVEQPGL